MILLRKICLKDLSEQGKSFKWEAHDCEKCHRRMWGHGYVPRYFAAIVVAVFMKRFRCPGCRAVVTTRPEDYWPGVRSSVSAIHQTLQVRLEQGHFAPGTSRQRAGHWLRKFVCKVQMDFGGWELLAALDFCFQKGLSFFV